MPIEDGGYYAIKGFEYQIDKTLIELLKSDNGESSVNIEQIQDIDSDNWVIQVKFKEAAKFVPSAVKKPIVQLIDEFLEHKDKKYYLYCYFGDFNGYDEYFNKVTLDNLNTILGSLSVNYSSEEKEQFLASFYLISAPEFQEQFDSVIEQIQEFDFCKSYDEAIFYYSNVVDYIRKKIVFNRGDSIIYRTCTKNEIVNLMRDNKKLIFDSAYLEYLGKEQYERKVKKSFIQPNKRQNNIISFGNLDIDSSVSLEKLVHDIVDHHYQRATYDIKPLTFVIPDQQILDVKKYLIQNRISFNDGHEHINFNKEMFFEEPIINKKVTGRMRATDSLGQTSFKLRLISKSNFKDIEDIFHGQMYYYFNEDSCRSISKNSYIQINMIDTVCIRGLFI